MTDWDSLSKQLKSLGVELGKDKRPTPKRGMKYPIEDVVEGQFWDVIYGQVFCHEEVYPQAHLHGRVPLMPVHPITRLCQWANAAALTDADLPNFVFLDTETSGLAGGTGTYAFEVGVGRFTEEGFRLAQFFMRHPGEETALLAGLTAFMDGMGAVVTYNGKAFDIPLLNTRYTMMGLSSPFTDIDHFDLLPLARRLWRTRLESRTLSNVEERILGVTRSEQEVPGYLIPEMYFEYLKSHDARPMAGIFYHNAIDILSLAGLFSHMAFLLQEPSSEEIIHAEDTVSLARFFESLGEVSQAETLYQKALNEDLPQALYWDTLERFSFLLKRKGDWRSAIRLWEQAAQANQMYAFEELAKYYEHHVKQLLVAREWTSHAIRVLEKEYFPAHEVHYWQQSLDHRLKRLDRKISQQNDD
jgi:uncharacterized protein YprB with RNaseH-like and TPR domain